MDKKIKAKWIKALRSGKYQQGFGMLRTDDAYCCLGVLCLVADMTIDADGYHVASDKDGYSAIEKLGLTEEEMVVLYSKNDRNKGNGKSNFPQIADYIEKNL